MKILFSMIIAAGLGLAANAQLSNTGPVSALVNERLERQSTFTKAAPFAIAPKSDDRDALVDGAVDNATVLKADGAALAALLAARPEELDLRIPVQGGEVELLLVASDIFSDDFAVVTASNDLPFDYVPGLHYRGIVKGQPASLAAISIFKDEVMGSVNDAQGDHTLGKLEGSADEHVYYAVKDFKGAADVGCSTADDGVGYTEEQLKGHGSAKTVNCVNLYWEVNYDVFQNKGSVTNTTNYVTGLFNQSSTIYNNDGISVLLSQVYVWDVTSPYTATSTSSLLSQFQSYRNSFNGNLGNLLGYAGGGGIAAGFSGLCNSNLDNSQCYSGIQSAYSTVPTYSWSVMVVTHEQGHLLGSRHTHACVWNGNNTAIDGCGQQAGYSEGTCATGPIPSTGGTIMSYCHLNAVGINFNNGFGTQPKNVIVNNINAATCLTACSGGGCGTPGSLTASSLTTTSATVSWGAVSGATSYNLQWKLASATTWTTVSGLTTTSYALSGLVANTTYNFQVQAVCSSGSSSYSATASFTTLSGTGCPDVLEANNSTATAATITLPASINALIATSTDVDFYAFTTTATTNISIGLGNLAGDYDVKLLNSAGTQVAISQAGGTTSEAITYNSAAAGTYYINVYGYGGAFSATQCYLLTASATAVAGCTDSYEPNNSSSTAYVIAANTTRTASIGTSTDKDWFQFANSTSQRNIKVSLTNLPADYDLRLYRGSTSLAVSQNTGTTAESIIYNTSTYSSLYRAYIYGYNGAYNASQCYTLTVQISGTAFLPSALEDEAIDHGDWKDEAGLTVFPNPASDQLTVLLAPSELTRTVDLVDAMGRTVWSTQQRNADGEVRLVMDVRAFAPGIYLVRATEGDLVVTKRVMIGR